MCLFYQLLSLENGYFIFGWFLTSNKCWVSYTSDIYWFTFHWSFHEVDGGWNETNILKLERDSIYKYIFIFSFVVRFWGDDELDRLSVTSRKMVTYTRVDCVGASKVIRDVQRRDKDCISFIFFSLFFKLKHFWNYTQLNEPRMIYLMEIVCMIISKQ